MLFKLTKVVFRLTKVSKKYPLMKLKYNEIKSIACLRGCVTNYLITTKVKVDKYAKSDLSKINTKHNILK